MNARDDYPYLRASAEGFNGERMAAELGRALDEIDRLRHVEQRAKDALAVAVVSNPPEGVLNMLRWIMTGEDQP